jgi:hypothetical protein
MRKQNEMGMEVSTYRRGFLSKNLKTRASSIINGRTVGGYEMNGATRVVRNKAIFRYYSKKRHDDANFLSASEENKSTPFLC